MKSLIILSLFILTAAITTAQAGSLVPVLAQAGADVPASEAPAAKPTEPAVKPAEPAAKPAEPKAPAAAYQKQSHKEFAEMGLKECTSCHKGAGIALTHDADWVRGHRLVSTRPDKNCKDCHQQSFCLDCHKGGGIDVDLRTEISRGGTMPNSHRTDFREIHPLKARDNPQTCARCHNAKYCSDCHAKFRGEDLMVLSHRKGWSNLQTSSAGPAHSTFNTNQCQTCHPNGLLPKNVWSADHGREARRNLQACQTCHYDGQTCMTCHSARSGLRINPHPRGWDGVKGNYRSRSDGRSCIKCHDNY